MAKTPSQGKDSVIQTANPTTATMDPMAGGQVKTMNQPPTDHKLGPSVVEAGPIQFHIKHIDVMYDQGVSISVVGSVNGVSTELLRFECYDWNPCYYYDPSGKNKKHVMDKTTTGNPVGWAVKQLRDHLAAMLKEAGASELAKTVNIAETNKKLDEVEVTARDIAIKKREVVTHNRGDVIIEAGNIRFGLEYRTIDRAKPPINGLAIHVLGDVAGQEVELLAFDHFDIEPHYHYGPRNKNIRLYWDTTITPDPLRWTVEQFKSGKLPEMISRAGYPGIVAELDTELIKQKLPEIESTALAIVRQRKLT